jgi:hypothetical protein
LLFECLVDKLKKCFLMLPYNIGPQVQAGAGTDKCASSSDRIGIGGRVEERKKMAVFLFSLQQVTTRLATTTLLIFLSSFIFFGQPSLLEDCPYFLLS